ncbi:MULTISPECIES: hypothetical protein [unclassified Streptomyces]|uniref:hypothetical protein n=1 Tax=unclassified Streptomyces TaxID=2593676 RepID=UPI002E22DF13|nr:hypothetical protein OG217_36235 [Streptomyces sp. NBC_01023]
MTGGDALARYGDSAGDTADAAANPPRERFGTHQGAARSKLIHRPSHTRSFATVRANM